MAKYKFTQAYNAETKREELNFTIPGSDFQEFIKKSLKKVSEQTVLPGFRKGKAPESQVLTAKYNEITEQAINLAINDAINSIEVLEPRPLEQLEVTNVTFNEANDLVLSMSYLPVPETVVPDITKIKFELKEAKKADEKEVDSELENLWHFYEKKINPDAKKEEFALEKLNEDFFERTGIRQDYPEIKDADDLRKFIKDYINETYEVQANTIWENEVVNEVLKQAKFEKVEGIIDRELDRRIENYKSRFTAIGMDAKEYMAKNNVTEESLKNDWYEMAERDIKLELLLQKYGEINEIEPTEEEIQENIKDLDDNTKKTYSQNPEALRSLVRYYYINQKSYNQIMDVIRANSGEKETKSN